MRDEGSAVFDMERREFISLLGSAQQATMPVVGFLHTTSPDTNIYRLRAFRQGLKDAGFAEDDLRTLAATIKARWICEQAL
jgi:hypothetical protein